MDSKALAAERAEKSGTHLQLCRIISPVMALQNFRSCGTRHMYWWMKPAESKTWEPCHTGKLVVYYSMINFSWSLLKLYNLQKHENTKTLNYDQKLHSVYSPLDISYQKKHLLSWKYEYFLGLFRIFYDQKFSSQCNRLKKQFAANKTTNSLNTIPSE
jgi:hypothetical protein